MAGLSGPEVLYVAARQSRILVTHDRRMMPGYFRDRLAAGKESPGDFIVAQSEPIGPVVEVSMMVWAASDPLDWCNHIRHLPSLTSHVYGRLKSFK